MVECLERWQKCHTIQDHEVRRKIASRDGKHKVWVDSDGSTRHEEEGPDGRIMKKHKGAKHCSKHNDHETEPNQRNRAYNSEEVTGRKKHKIWNSKNRKPEKNMPISSVHFQQSFKGTDINNQPLGCSEFHMGSTTLQLVEIDNTNFTPKGRPRCMFYNQIMAKQAKLVEIATRINATSENGLLLSSIRGISFRNLKNFSAKINEAGNRGAGTHNPQAQNRDSTRNKEKGKGNDHVIVNMSNRNVVNNPRQQVSQEKQNGEVHMETPVVNNHPEINQPIDPSPGGNKEINGNGHTHETTHKKPKISILETKNRFALLDEEGNEIMDMIGEKEEDDNMGKIPRELHMGWIRKQERVLNARYYKNLTQDQRFEAKRYILDRLIPLDSTLSCWLKSLVEYFRHLSRLYNFGDGYLAAVRF
ncbi:hypothetical protein L1987_86998 [Smallanthus sonchifolius]|uniref:Uncharacterized protein n=1 Tax=Smallanthus sonchifolius TaxID=185202 RepID=A0ACB8Y0A1_9ASTR|nr:hypothetical protein L1987_86998 [Smallanthus sonchifolius]